jgi:hypothetical protein
MTEKKGKQLDYHPALIAAQGTDVNLGDYAISTDSVVKQIGQIQELMKRVMKEGEHYGTIPGTERKCDLCNGTGKGEDHKNCLACGGSGKLKKPSLFKPGAEKLGFTFRLRPEFDLDVINLGDGHREYRFVCRLIHIPTGANVGEGVGTCSTMEGKYRYRWDNTEKEVPKEYWDNGDKTLLGGRYMQPRKAWMKEDGQSKQKWFIFQRVEHDNPADYYNTCEKIGKKRAHVDAILTATAASDIFSQDLEEDEAAARLAAERAAETEGGGKPADAPPGAPKKKDPPSAKAQNGEKVMVTDKQISAIQGMLTMLQIKDDFERHMKVTKILNPKATEPITSLKNLMSAAAPTIIKALAAEVDGKKGD